MKNFEISPACIARKDSARIIYAKKQRELMATKIAQLQEENAETAKRNAQANERHQKQVDELRKSMEKMRKRQSASDAGSENAKISDFKAKMAARKKAYEEEMERMQDELGDLTEAKPKKSSRSMSVSDLNETTPIRKSAAYASRDESLEGSAVAQLAVTLNRAYMQQLPMFSGNPKEWPMFESIYNRTTIDGDFNERKNIERLGRALRGEARNTVVDLWMFSEDTENIMDELRRSYGRPERVIVGLMEDIMSIKSPRDQAEHKLRDFAVKVKNFVASAKAMHMEYESILQARSIRRHIASG